MMQLQEGNFWKKELANLSDKKENNFSNILSI